MSVDVRKGTFSFFSFSIKPLIASPISLTLSILLSEHCIFKGRPPIVSVKLAIDIY